MWHDGWLGRTILVLMILSVALIPLSIWATMKEHERCVARGGHIVNKTSTSVGVGPAIGGNGGVAVVPVTTTVSFCVSEDGRILEN